MRPPSYTRFNHSIAAAVIMKLSRGGSLLNHIRRQSLQLSPNAIAPVNTGFTNQFVHPRGVDTEAAKGLLRLVEDRLKSRQLCNVLAPLLNAGPL